jgi:hypothetical protein
MIVQEKQRVQGTTFDDRYGSKSAVGTSRRRDRFVPNSGSEARYEVWPLGAHFRTRAPQQNVSLITSSAVASRLGAMCTAVGTIRNPAIETLRDSFSLLGAIGVFDAAPRANYMKIDSRRATKMRHTISPSKI